MGREKAEGKRRSIVQPRRLRVEEFGEAKLHYTADVVSKTTKKGAKRLPVLKCRCESKRKSDNLQHRSNSCLQTVSDLASAKQ